MSTGKPAAKPAAPPQPAAAKSAGSAPAVPTIVKPAESITAKVKETAGKSGSNRNVGGEKEKVREKVFEQQAQNIQLDTVVKTCVDLTASILEILKQHNEEDNKEFVESIRSVESVLDQITKNAGVVLSKMDLVRLQYYLEDFQNKLVKIQTNGKLMKFLTSNRLRKKLEEANLNICYILKRLEKPGDGATSITASPSRIFFSDDQGKLMWEKLFGLENNLIEWHKFVKGMAEFLKQKWTLQEEMILRRVLDDRCLGSVTPYKFSQFLRGFGPLKDCVANAKRLLSEPWFHGFLSRREVGALLAGAKVGTFLVRFSKSQPGSFALCFVAQSGTILNVMIDSELPKGVKIKEQGGTERRFRDLWELMENYREHLTTPYDDPLPDESWFQGDLVPDEADLLLNGKQAGTFLVHMGDTPAQNVSLGFLLAYVDSTGKVIHTPIEKSAKGYALASAPAAQYSSIRELLLANRSFLRYNFDKCAVPLFKVAPLSGEPTQLSLAGPQVADQPEDPKNLNNSQYAACSSSTYPTNRGLWSIICDRYQAEIFPNWRVVALADGCNWGNRPKTAAWKACGAFMEFVKSQHASYRSTHEVAYLLLKGFSLAHERVIEEHKEDVWDAGTTTLIGGVLLPLQEGTGPHDPRFGFVCASVGDCKAFVYSPKTRSAVDVTLGNRGGLDATDPGGRLGPFVGRSGEPDLRNLHVYFALCEPGDMIIVMSDGVHDNLDAYSLGITPHAAGIPGVQPTQDWKDVNDKDIGRHKSVFMCRRLEEILKDVEPHDAAHIVQRFIDTSMRITESSRKFMNDFPNRKLPIDYVAYPGKMDHATVVCLTV